MVRTTTRDRATSSSTRHPAKKAQSSATRRTDVNISGVVVFLGGLFGFVLIFFFACFLIGRVINDGLNKQDGPTKKWTMATGTSAGGSPQGKGSKRQDLKSNAAMEQEELGLMTSQFPSPRLQMDDGNQDTADLHAREDLLLNNYSSMPGQPGVRIPIDQAMVLIAQRGLPVAAAPSRERSSHTTTLPPSPPRLPAASPGPALSSTRWKRGSNDWITARQKHRHTRNCVR